MERLLDRETLARAKESAAEKAPATPPSCLKCGHLKVCAVYRALAPLMGNWPDEQRPFEAQEIAGICSEYAEQFITIRSQQEARTDDNKA